MLPSKLYPRKEFVLPEVMTEAEVKQLLQSLTDLRQKAVIGLFYGAGMRLAELKNLQWTDIERANNRLMIRQGKGNKDRYTLLPKTLLADLEIYYRSCRTKVYLFESKQMKGRSLHERSLQNIVNSAMMHSGFQVNIPPTRFAIPLPPICLIMVVISTRLKSCWVTAESKQP